jgi:hypothetical protein
MRALTFRGIEDHRLRVGADPRIERPDRASSSIEVSAICGSTCIPILAAKRVSTAGP